MRRECKFIIKKRRTFNKKITDKKQSDYYYPPHRPKTRNPRLDWVSCFNPATAVIMAAVLSRPTSFIFSDLASSYLSNRSGPLTRAPKSTWGFALEDSLSCQVQGLGTSGQELPRWYGRWGGFRPYPTMNDRPVSPRM